MWRHYDAVVDERSVSGTEKLKLTDCKGSETSANGIWLQ
jgi:hypothetical protein